MSIIKRKAGSKDIVKSVLEFDEVPTEGSHNLVESGAVSQAIGNLGQPLQWKGPATVVQLNAGITGIQPGWTYTLTDAGTLTDGSVAVDVGDEVAWTEDGEWFQVGPSLVELKADVVQAKSDIADIQDVVPEEASESNKLVTKDELDNVQESIQSGFTPKGEISVSDLNDLTTQSNGDQYILTDSGTITDGSVTVEAGDSVAWNSTDSVWYKVKQYALSKYGTDEIKNLQTSITSFRTGDVIPVDGPNGTAKMGKDDLLKETAQNALAGNVAPAFDETGATTYLAGTPVSRGGKTYVFKVDHSGVWDASNVEQIPSSEAVLKVCRSKIIQTNYIPSSLDNLKESFVYIVQRTTGLTTTGFPADAPAEGVFKLSVIKSYSSSSAYQVEQELKMVVDTSKIWRRAYNTITSAWTAWSQSNFALSVEKNQIFSSWNKNLANLNDAPINSILRLTVTSATATLNIPQDFLIDSANDGELTTCKCYYSNSDYRIYQNLTRISDNVRWWRTWSSVTTAWGPWHRSAVQKNIIKIGAGQQYTTLRAGFNAAFDLEGAKIIVYPGTYDLVQEYSDVLLDAPLTGVSTPCPLGNDMHAIFLDGVHVTAKFERPVGMSDAHYASIKNYFEPFGFRKGSFTLENLEIESKNCRYCVHDDQGTGPYVHKYINCKMTRYVDNEAVGNNYINCIGGGLQKNGTVVIEGGWYKTITNYGSPSICSGDPLYSQQPISYHNYSGSGAESSIEIHNVYLADRGYIQIADYGSSTLKTKLYVSGCRFGLPVLHRGVEASSIENMEITADWNNEQVVQGGWVVNPSDKRYATFVPSV